MEFGEGKEALVLVILLLLLVEENGSYCDWCWCVGNVAFWWGKKILVLVVLVCLWCGIPPPMEEPVQFRETRRRPNSTLNPRPLLGVNLILQLVGLHGRKIVDLNAEEKQRG